MTHPITSPLSNFLASRISTFLPILSPTAYSFFQISTIIAALRLLLTSQGVVLHSCNGTILLVFGAEINMSSAVIINVTTCNTTLAVQLVQLVKSVGYDRLRISWVVVGLIGLRSV